MAVPSQGVNLVPEGSGVPRAAQDRRQGRHQRRQGQERSGGGPGARAVGPYHPYRQGQKDRHLRFGQGRPRRQRTGRPPARPHRQPPRPHHQARRHALRRLQRRRLSRPAEALVLTPGMDSWIRPSRILAAVVFRRSRAGQTLAQLHNIRSAGSNAGVLICGQRTKGQRKNHGSGNARIESRHDANL